MNKTSTIGISIAVVIILIGGGVFAARSFGTSSAPSVAQAEAHDIVQEVHVTGAVTPVSEYKLSFGTSGVLANVYVHKGDIVQAGQLLATLDASDIAMQRAVANATLIGDQEVAATNLTNAQQGLSQVQKTNAASIANATQKVLDARTYMNKMQDIFTDVSNDGDIDTTSITYITAAQSLANAKNAYNEAVTSFHALEATAAQGEVAAKSQLALTQASSQAKSAINQAQLGYQNAVLGKTVLRAPAAGVITSEDVQKGEYASPAQSTVTVMSSDLQIETSVSEADVAHVKVGQAAQVTFDAMGLSHSFNATVSKVDAAATNDNGVSSYKVTLKITQHDDRIKSGMTANVSIPVAEKKNVVAVPSDSVFMDGTTYFVNIPDGKSGSHKQTVTLGLQGTNGYDEIVSGVQLGDQVLSFTSK